jgi:hypothetical protein
VIGNGAPTRSTGACARATSGAASTPAPMPIACLRVSLVAVFRRIAFHPDCRNINMA